MLGSYLILTYPEVGRAGREDDPVRLDELPLGAEGDVDEGLLLEQRVEHGEDGRAVVVPLQAELLLGRRSRSRRRRSGPCRHSRRQSWCKYVRVHVCTVSGSVAVRTKVGSD